VFDCVRTLFISHYFILKHNGMASTKTTDHTFCILQILENKHANTMKQCINCL